ncbi:MAG: Na+/H+ antiporter NhaA [Desulfobulbaceae bacterium A2]|nr:MAG: Na+/H+ antiporter NhaA [Desulfobulbaceae bacterium A2]
MTTSEQAMLSRFLHSQAASSLVLLLAAVGAVVWANSSAAGLYVALSHLDIGFSLADRSWHMHLAHWVKDGLMTVFFLVVGLEIKRELLIGELADRRQAALPVMAALGGAVVPALIYLGLNSGGAGVQGWGVPMATDIAFALGILAVLGARVPLAMKVFLTALAIVDDLLAVLVIAVFYTATIEPVALALAGGCLVVLAWMVRRKNQRRLVLLLPMLGVWLCMLNSGVHATIAGVLIALAIPVRSGMEPEQYFAVLRQQGRRMGDAEEWNRHSVVQNGRQRRAVSAIAEASEEMLPLGLCLERDLHVLQAFGILPLFALFAAGVTFDRAMLANFPSSIGLGIIIALVLGKPLGILALSWLTVRSGLGRLPAGMGWAQLTGVGFLGGIGFTMSIFVSELAFAEGPALAEAKLAVFLASLIAGLAGLVFLFFALPRRGKKEENRSRDSVVGG